MNIISHMFFYADLMTMFILVALCSISILCLAVIFQTFMYLRREKKGLLSLLRQLRSVSAHEDFFRIGDEYKERIGGRYLLHNLHEIEHMASQAAGTVDVDALEMLLNQSLDHVMLKEERYLPLLGTSAAVAPLIGLFGTVWGLVRAFTNIGLYQVADITIIAPGIAQALITTLAGLIVAVPALIFFNYFSNEMRKIEHYLYSVSDILLLFLKRQAE